MDKERCDNLKSLESLMGYTFKDIRLLDVALTHRSHTNEMHNPERLDNERLEFLGDSVISLCISALLITRFPKAQEGDLSKLRASVVNRHSLAEVADRFMLGSYLLLGKGEEASGGRKKTSIMADTMEALLGAIYLDGGYEEVFSHIESIFGPLLARETSGSDHHDYKSILQEFCQKEYKEIPHYTLIGKRGPDHDTRYEVSISIGGKMKGTGNGRSKKAAEQEAARNVLENLTDDEG